MSIRFTIANPAVARDPLRCDIVVLLGLLPRRPGPLPEPWLAQLRELGLERALDQAPDQRADARGLPLRCDGWADVRALFAVGPGEPGAGCASARFLRRYFAEGGRTAVVLHAGDPAAADAIEADRVAALGRLLRGDDSTLAHLAEPAAIAGGLPPADDAVLEDGSVRDLGCLRVIDDAAVLVVPDLAWLLASDPPQPGLPPAGPLPETFVPCSEDLAGEPYRIRLEGTPRLAADAWQAWATAIADLRRRCVALGRDDCQLLTGLPLATPEGPRPDDPDSLERWRDAGLLDRGIQLCWPWLGDARDPEQPADDPAAAVAGILARSTLTSGCWTSLGHQRLARRTRLLPTPDWRRFDEAITDRLTGFERDPAGGHRLRNDRSSLGHGPFAFAAVVRLHGMLVRACRHLGRDLAFEANGPETWRRLRLRLTTLIEQVYRGGGLRGANRSQAFTVLCDRQTHTQADLDAGRLIVELRYQPALPVETITVRFAVGTGLPAEVTA